MRDLSRHFSKNSFYHVYGRGNNKQKIFFDDKDHHLFINLVKKYSNFEKIGIFSFVVMPNHYHMLVQQKTDNPVSRLMLRLLTAFAMYWNEKYNKVGHVFQKPFCAIECQDPIYLLNLIRYIHLNPIRAKMVKNAEYYKWSSHKYYLHHHLKTFIDRSLIHKNDMLKNKNSYLNFLNNIDSKESKLINLAIEIPIQKKLSYSIDTLKIIAKKIFKKHNVEFHNESSLTGRGNKCIRADFVKKARNEGYAVKDIAEWLNIHRSKL